MTDLCVLCHEPLSDKATNLEHYVHQVLIRNFDILCVPESFSWALRRDERERSGVVLLENTVLAPRSEHKRWATVRVHQECNSELSYVGRDFKHIIDNIDTNIPDRKFLGIFKYYSNLWSVDPYELVVRILTKKEADYKYRNKKYDIVYEPFLLSCGRIEIECPKSRRALIKSEKEKVMHTIVLGSHDSLIQL